MRGGGSRVGQRERWSVGLMHMGGLDGEAWLVKVCAGMKAWWVGFALAMVVVLKSS